MTRPDDARVPERRIAFLTMEETAGWSIDADLGFAPLGALGWYTEWLPWRRPGVDWDRYDAVYIAAPWDYPDDPQAFLGVLQAIDRSRAVLVNDLSLVRWNLAKTYLRDLEARGAAIVPSLWFECFDDADPEQWFENFAAGLVIVKPVVSTNAADTFLLARQTAHDTLPLLRETFRARAFVVQPFIDSILEQGEFSLFYFDDTYSHAIRKVPAPGDFRVQEEHGASILAHDAEPALRQAGDRVMQLVRPTPVYCRCDFVRGDGGFLLMELELIEPSMYLRMHAEAPRRFALAIDRYVRSHRG